MSRKAGKWWDGGSIVYSDDGNVVRMRTGMWFIGVALLATTIGLVVSPESREDLSLEHPWRLALQVAVLLIFFALGLILAQSLSFRADKSKGTFRLTRRWLGLPYRSGSGKLDEIEHLLVRESVHENSDVGGSTFHLYLRLREEELLLFQLDGSLTGTEARRLAVFLECPLVLTDEGLITKKETYRRIESVKDMQEALSKMDEEEKEKQQ